MKIVAEIGASHNGSLDRALQTVRAAAGAGADAIKLQTWSPDTMDAGGRVLDSGPWKGRSLRDLYREAHTPWEWHEPLIAEARDAGMDWHSTPFDGASIDFLESLGCPAYKIAAFELVDIGLIRGDLMLHDIGGHRRNHGVSRPTLSLPLLPLKELGKLGVIR